MYRLGSVRIQKFNRFFELRAADDGIVYEKQILIHDQLMNGNLLHLGDFISVRLILRHKTSRPSGRVFDVRTGERNSALVRISDSVRRSRIWHTAYKIDVVHVSDPRVLFRHDPAVAGTHDFHVHPFVGGGGVAVIRP